MLKFLSAKRNAASPEFVEEAAPLVIVQDIVEVDLNTLYDEALSLVEQTRTWFEGPGKSWKKTLPLAQQAMVASENLAIIARLTSVIAWLSYPKSPRNHPESAPELPANHPLKPVFGGQISEKTRQLLLKIPHQLPHNSNPWRINNQLPSP